MTMIAATRQCTPEDLLHLDGDKLYELVDGQLVEKQMSFLSGKCAAIITQILMNYLENTTAGELASEVTFQCFPHDRNLVRRPDIAFISAEKIAAVPAEGHVRIAPDIAIEIISPGDRINDFEDKLADYRSAGIKLVWEVNPTFRYVRIHRPDRTTSFFEENDMLTGEVVLPGFSARVSDLMPSATEKSG